MWKIWNERHLKFKVSVILFILNVLNSIIIIKRNWLVVDFIWKENRAYLCTKEQVVHVFFLKNFSSKSAVLKKTERHIQNIGTVIWIFRLEIPKHQHKPRKKPAVKCIENVSTDFFILKMLCKYKKKRKRKIVILVYKVKQIDI